MSRLTVTAVALLLAAGAALGQGGTAPVAILTNGTGRLVWQSGSGIVTGAMDQTSAGSADGVGVDSTNTPSAGWILYASDTTKTNGYWAAAPAGDGNTTNHADLVNLDWPSSGHTGTASRIAGFNASGAAQEIAVSGDGISFDGTNLTAARGLFRAYNAAANNNVADDTLIYPWDTTTTNTLGGTWTAATGTYTVPSAGTYLIVVDVYWQDIDDQRTTQINFIVNGSADKVQKAYCSSTAQNTLISAAHVAMINSGGTLGAATKHNNGDATPDCYGGTDSFTLLTIYKMD